MPSDIPPFQIPELAEPHSAQGYADTYFKYDIRQQTHLKKVSREDLGLKA
jgi:hypothetical protein